MPACRFPHCGHRHRLGRPGLGRHSRSRPRRRHIDAGRLKRNHRSRQAGQPELGASHSTERPTSPSPSCREPPARPIARTSSSRNTRVGPSFSQQQGEPGAHQRPDPDAGRPAALQDEDPRHARDLHQPKPPHHMGNVAVAFDEFSSRTTGRSSRASMTAGRRTFDALVARIDVAPIPLPAAGWLLLGGLAASASPQRRRSARA